MRQSPRLRPLSPLIGTEITGLDLSRPLAEATFAQLEAALERTAVLVFRDQHLTPAHQVDFSRRFGPLESYPMRQFTLPDASEVLVLSNVLKDGKPIGVVDAGQYWHFDSSWRAAPSLGSLLYARELPAAGGDTLFVNMQTVYDALPFDIRMRITDLVAVHDYVRRNEILSAKPGGRPRLTEAQRNSAPPVRHPLVCRHPGTARPCLFLNEGFVFDLEGVPPEEGQALLRWLFAFSTDPRFIYRHRWRPNDLVFWDNRTALHRATELAPGMRRTMHRTTVAGSPPHGLSQPGASG